MADGLFRNQRLLAWWPIADSGAGANVKLACPEDDFAACRTAQATLTPEGTKKYLMELGAMQSTDTKGNSPQFSKTGGDGTPYSGYCVAPVDILDLPVDILIL